MAVKIFSPQFRPVDFQGPLSQHYPKREDLFQQLIGAFLRERFGTRVHVSPTKGRDGSIDIYIEAGDDPQEKFFNLPFPLIVECKDHDDTLTNLARNIDTGWTRVRDKLSRHARKGWEGTYQPWRQAKSYLYCISAIIANKQSHKELGKSINDFFIDIEADFKPAVCHTCLCDWSDLHPFLLEHPRLADNWLGTTVKNILDHEAYKASLTGFREYLKEGNLPFVAPTREDPAHQERILDALSRNAGNKGIILVGAGGVGKTRTCFEVAEQAYQRGWRVLHIIPGEPAISVTELAEVVLQGSTPTLLVFDYIDQLRNLDLGTIRHRLLPETEIRGISLALLANARPGILRRANPEWETLFQRVELKLGERSEIIRTRIQERLTPEASKILGADRIRELCGTRPIIGMFIAGELERYAYEGKLDEGVVARLRQGDLQSWLRRRFQEDGLLPKETEELLPPTPGSIMISAAAGLATTPLRLEEVEKVISKTLEACEDTTAAAKAPLIVTSLLRSGWIEDRSSELATPHDVVADELLELTIFDRDLLAIRPGITEKVLTSAKDSPRVLGRLSVSFDRVIGQEDFPDQLKKALESTISRWLEQCAAEIGLILTTADSDEVSYALGAVMSYDRKWCLREI